MNYQKYTNASEFLEENNDFLYQSEAANNLMIGITNGLKMNKKLKEDIFICSIKNKNKTLLAAIMTPPHDLVISTQEMERAPINLLIENLMPQGIDIPGILAPNKIADYFCREWKQKKDIESILFRRERIYQLVQCNDIKQSNGYFKVADEGDINLVAGWIVSFHEAINEKINQKAARRMSENKVKNKAIYLWIDDTIVSMCASDRETLNGKVINLVYTPSIKRKMGYATSCVYNLCLRILQEGKSFCSLFTDLDNPTSNSVYSKIGFNPIMDLLHYRFYKKRSLVEISK